MKKNLILGVGNPLLCDDAIGPVVIRRAETALSDMKQFVDFKENYAGGFDLLEEIQGYDRLLLIDCVKTGICKPGTCQIYSVKDFEKYRQERSFNSHSLNLPTLINLGRACGYHMPEEIIVFGIEARDTTTFSEEPTDEVRACIDDIIDRIRSTILQWGDCDTV